MEISYLGKPRKCGYFKNGASPGLKIKEGSRRGTLGREAGGRREKKWKNNVA